MEPPRFKSDFVGREEDDRSTHLHRQLIGYLGALLPVLVWGVSALLPTPPQPRLRPWDSISAYYYSSAVPVFAGILASLSVFLFTYKGYDNDHQWKDRLAAGVAGGSALGVAFFPTPAPHEALARSWWSDWMGWAHYGSALALFVSFVFFCGWLFPMGGRSSGAGRRRNIIYRLCGVAIVLCLASIPVMKKLGKPIFYSEALALWAFALSWLTKGRAAASIGPALERAWYYTRHPLSGWQAFKDRN